MFEVCTVKSCKACGCEPAPAPQSSPTAAVGPVQDIKKNGMEAAMKYYQDFCVLTAVLSVWGCTFLISGRGADAENLPEDGRASG